MNPFYNPVFLSKVLKSYLFDINRLKRFDTNQLQRFRDKKFKHIVEFAYTVPLYHDIYRSHGIHPDDITGLKDIKHLPFVTKEDIKKYYPLGIISKNTSPNNFVEVSTSGTTGKSLSIFVDMFDVVMGLFGYLRTIREYGLNWRSSKLTIIGDFASHTAETGYIKKALQPKTKSSFIFKNIQWLDTNASPLDNIKQISTFEPDFIGGYVGMLAHMALLKEQGHGTNIRPSVIACTGSVLDPQLRNYIKDCFNAQVYEVYGATETGPIAFECKHGGYHVMSDLLHLEFIDDKGENVEKKPGKLVVTKLFGRGTPIIRYNAINDIVEPSSKKCSCDISGDVIKKIYGRETLSILLADGTRLMPTAFAEIFSKLLYQLKTTKIIDTRIIQKDMSSLDIDIVIDKKQHDNASVEQIISIIQTGFEQIVGPGVTVRVKQVKSLGKQKKRIVSKISDDALKTEKYI
ncbi:MAG: hypothetical protein R6V50_03520 [Thermoplasmatota archaeon]